MPASPVGCWYVPTVLTSVYCLVLSQRRLRWLGNVRRRLPKDILYGQLTSGARPVGRPALRFKDSFKRGHEGL